MPAFTLYSNLVFNAIFILIIKNPDPSFFTPDFCDKKCLKLHYNSQHYNSYSKIIEKRNPQPGRKDIFHTNFHCSFAYLSSINSLQVFCIVKGLVAKKLDLNKRNHIFYR